MSMTVADLRERFRGCLLGLAVGDALGGQFEAQGEQRQGRGRA
jgi:ADP-ribosylglycohydrolase